MTQPRSEPPVPFKVETTITRIDEAQAQPSGGECCLIVMYGTPLGRRYFLSHTELVIGRSEDTNIQIDQDSVSRHHVKIMVQPDQTVLLVDLGSTNGTFVNNLRVGEHTLVDGDMVRVGQTIFKYLTGSNIENKYHEEIYRLTTVDGLTEVYNKRYFLDTLEREINRASRYRRLVSLAMFDIDHFKKVNDTHGHLAGDSVLHDLAQLVAQNVRRQDIFARYGGEEFAIILPEVDEQGALILCEKLRSLAEQHPFSYNGVKLHVTISLGIHSFHGQEETTEEFIAAADKKLYQAKTGGRNRVVI